MFDLSALDERARLSSPTSENKAGGIAYRLFKRGSDVAVCLLLLPILVTVGLVILILNPVLNPGRLFFVQLRMGRDCKPFHAVKFRTMRPAPQVTRRADSPLEKDRITPLGGFLRRSRIDELPQILNVLRGQMSLIGPRPDYFDHAVEYLERIPGYRERHAVHPGISGLAQTELGYAEGVEATRRKVQADLYYITRRSIALDVWIFWRTLKVIVSRGGA